MNKARRLAHARAKGQVALTHMTIAGLREHGLQKEYQIAPMTYERLACINANLERMARK